MSEEITLGLPADLAEILRDQSVVVPQDAGVFAMIAAWTHAPATTASAEIRVTPDGDLVETMYRDSHVGSSTTPAGCC